MGLNPFYFCNCLLVNVTVDRSVTFDRPSMLPMGFGISMDWRLRIRLVLTVRERIPLD